VIEIIGENVRVLGLNSSARKTGNTRDFLRHALKHLERMDVKTELLHLVDFNIKPCSNCRYECLYDEKCPIEDDYFALIEKIENADAVIIGAPVYAGSPPAIMKAFLERGNSMTIEQSAATWKNKPVALFVIGSLGNQHSLQTLIAGLSSGYGGIEPFLVGTAVVATRNMKYPDAWRNGGLIKDEHNQKLMEKLADRIYRTLTKR
jgi:multimeric flavodoxin WrbA